MRALLTTAVGVAVLLAAVAGARAQAWLAPPDGYYFKLAANYLESGEEFNASGQLQPIFADDPTRTSTSFREMSLLSYLEYGLSESFTLVAALPFKVLTSRDTRSLPGEPVRRNELTNAGLSNLFLSLRVPLVQRSTAVALQGGVKLPLGYEKDPDNNGPPLGTGEVDMEVHLLLGQSLYPLPGYVGAGAGYRLRGGSLHDEMLFSLEGGWTIARVFVKLRLDGLVNVEDPPDLSGAAGADNSVIEGDQDIFKISPTMQYNFGGGLGVAAEAFHTFAGKNTVAGTTWSLGLVVVR